MSPLIIDSSIKNNSKITQGYNKVEIKENKAQIYCYGINFPTLLHEINKAVMEYIIAYGLPNELSDKQINIVYNKADDYKNEFYHYILSPTIWKELLSIANIENEQIPILIMKLSLLEYKALDELFDDIINNKPNAKEKLKKLC